MARRKEPVDHRLLFKVSVLYYLQDLTQQEIADRLQLSRPRVSRLLRQAREEGVVQINVVSSMAFLDLETELERRFGLKEVLIVETEAGERVFGQQLGVAAADYLQRTIQDGDVIGVTWGRTLQAMVNALQPRPVHPVRVVQTMGGLGPPEAEIHAANLSRRLAQLLGGTVTLLPAPGIVDRAESSAILRSDRYVREAMGWFPRLTMAFAGIGALSTNPVFERQGGILPDAAYEALAAAGAVGDIAMRFFDAGGKPVKTELDERTIGITLEELKAVPRVVGVAGGAEKVEAILGALRGRLINVLITDYDTAVRLQAA
ncbi:sugar-binding transcriptional regulator [Rhodocaloribacter litoris]|uniref:sugar-binding transcriptional regulator n=1 Tax=Rhodocaloribacter litoris TaxID=2558931 RepID=UPI0014204C4E|nr:sugar-binding transcriptional regulator [Rhodocaloribacter litoris]QXD15379.1 sugar-binding transcriptional regulator [Rhodocaloribacter litoris]